MSEAALGLDPLAVAVILAMAVVTYATKAGGLWILGRIDVSSRTEAALEVLPGAIVVSILVPELLAGGPPEWGGAAVVAIVARRSGNVLLALLAGVGTVLFLRGL